jgi:P27 family predicted phage terminase small subunit
VADVGHPELGGDEVNAAKPLAIVRLEGNRGKKKLPGPQEEVKFDPRAPECPDWLLPAAKAEWARVAPVLSASRVLTLADATMLAGYCQAYARWRKAETSSRKNANPMVALSFLKELRMICREFGMTPSARARMVLPSEAPKDDMEELLSGAK